MGKPRPFEREHWPLHPPPSCNRSPMIITETLQYSRELHHLAKLPFRLVAFNSHGSQRKGDVLNALLGVDPICFPCPRWMRHRPERATSSFDHDRYPTTTTAASDDYLCDTRLSISVTIGRCVTPNCSCLFSCLWQHAPLCPPHLLRGARPRVTARRGSHPVTHQCFACRKGNPG
jgi:hypothetical protein